MNCHPGGVLPSVYGNHAHKLHPSRVRDISCRRRRVDALTGSHPALQNDSPLRGDRMYKFQTIAVFRFKKLRAECSRTLYFTIKYITIFGSVGLSKVIDHRFTR